MSVPNDAIQLYLRAQAQRSDETIEQLTAVLAEDASLKTARTTFEGRDAVIAQVGTPQSAPTFQQATWSEPVQDGDSIAISGSLPITATLGGYSLRFSFDSEGRIRQIEQMTSPAPPLPPSPIFLNDELKTLINTAWPGSPFLVAAVDPKGQPRLSLRGTVQAYGDDKLAFWARNGEGTTVTGLETHPLMTLFYRNPGTRTTFYFYGRAWVTKDESERRAVYDASPEGERQADPNYKGVAVIIDLDKVEGVTPAGRVHMSRDA